VRDRKVLSILFEQVLKDLRALLAKHPLVQESLLLQSLNILDVHGAFLASPAKTIDLAQRN
jgi:hypothetical protein